MSSGAAYCTVPNTLGVRRARSRWVQREQPKSPIFMLVAVLPTNMLLGDGQEGRG